MNIVEKAVDFAERHENVNTMTYVLKLTMKEYKMCVAGNLIDIDEGYVHIRDGEKNYFILLTEIAMVEVIWD